MLSPVSEAVSIARSDDELARPVPPPTHLRSHPDEYEHHDVHPDEYMDDPHGRLHEDFGMSEDGHHHQVPMVVRQPDSVHHGIHGSFADESLHHPHDPVDYPEGHHSDLAGELGYNQTERSMHEEAIPIIRSDRSVSPGHQEMAILGDQPSQARGISASHISQGKAVSNLSRSRTHHDAPRAMYPSSVSAFIFFEMQI